MGVLEEKMAIVGSYRRYRDRFFELANGDYVGRSKSAIESFVSVADALDRIVELGRWLGRYDINSVPYRIGERAVSAMAEMTNVLEEVHKFAIDENDAAWRPRKEAIAQRINRLDQTIYDTAAPVIAVVQGATLDPDGLRARELREGADKILAEARNAAGEIKTLLSALQQDAAKGSARAHAKYFSDEAEANKSASKTWLKATCWTAGTTALAAAINVWWSVHFEPTDQQKLQVVLAKVLAFSVLLSAVVWCGRIYRSHRHNFVVNRHRSNALNSFETFAAVASDSETKNAVLLQATHSIFSPQPTGYVTNESETAGPAQIVELTRTLAGNRG